MTGPLKRDDPLKCSTARAAYYSYCEALGCGDDPRIEMAFLAGVAWAMGKIDDLRKTNHEYVLKRINHLKRRAHPTSDKP